MRKKITPLLTPINFALFSVLSLANIANAQAVQTCGTNGTLTGVYADGISCVLSNSELRDRLEITLEDYNANNLTRIIDQGWSRANTIDMTLNLLGNNVLHAPTANSDSAAFAVAGLSNVLMNIEGHTTIDTKEVSEYINGMNISTSSDSDIVLNLADTATLSIIGSRENYFGSGLNVTGGNNQLNFLGKLEIEGYGTGFFTGYGKNLNVNILNSNSTINAITTGISVYAPQEFVSVNNAGTITAGEAGISVYLKDDIKHSEIINTGTIITTGGDSNLTSYGIISNNDFSLQQQEATLIRNSGTIESLGGEGSMNITATAADVTIETSATSNLRTTSAQSSNIRASVGLMNTYDYNTGDTNQVTGDININAAGLIRNETDIAHNNFGIAAFYTQSLIQTDWVEDGQGDWQEVNTLVPRADGLLGNVALRFGNNLADQIVMKNNSLEADSASAAIAVYAENGNINVDNNGTLTGEGQGITGILVKHDNNYGEGSIAVSNSGHITDLETGILISGAAKTTTVQLNHGSLIDTDYGIKIETMADADLAKNQINLASGSIIKGKNAAISLTNHAVSTFNEINNAGSLSSANDLLLLETNSAATTLQFNNQTQGVMTGIFDIASAQTQINNEGTWIVQDRLNHAAIVNLGLALHNTINNTGTLNFNNAKTEIRGIETFNMNGGLMDLTTHSGAGTEVMIGKDNPNSTFIANGGLIKMDVALGNDQSITDRIYVNNVIAGSTDRTRIYVNNDGGIGGLTDQGIQLVDVSAHSDNQAFTLANSIQSVTLANTVVAGAYEYVLSHKNQADGKQGWYLSSKAIDNNNAVDPINWKGIHVDENTILYRPDSGVNIANQQGFIDSITPGLKGNASSAIGIGSSGSLRASSRLNDAKMATENGISKSNSFWSFVTANTSEGYAEKGQISYKSDTKIAQMGADTSFSLGNGLIQVGVMGAYGDVKTDSTNQLTHSTGTGQTKGYSAGIYGTWYANYASVLSPYVDMAITHGRYDNQVSTTGNATAKYKSNATSVTLQTGYPIALMSNIILEPQAQITYLHYSADDYTDHTQTRVSNTVKGNTIARVGAHIYANNTTFKPYVSINAWYDNTTNLVKYNGVEISSDKKSPIMEAKLGFQAKASSNLTLWGEVGIRKGKNSTQDLGGSAGLKYSF